MMPTSSILFALVSLPLADWPNFGGPERTAILPELGIELDWDENAPEELWSKELGGGYGGAAIRDGEVFMLDREIGKSDVLRVFDLVTGEEQWSVEYEATGRLNFPGSRTVPAVTDEHVYTVGGLGAVTAFDREGEKVLWSVHLEDDFGGREPMFGWANSPLLTEDAVIVTPLGPEIGIVALKRDSGEVLWKTGPVGWSHSTPVLLQLQGKSQVLFMSTNYPSGGKDESAPTTLSSFDPETGELNWQADTELTRLPIPGPVRIDDETLFLTGGYRGGSSLVKLVESGGTVELDVVFHSDRGSQIHQPIFHGGHLYIAVNENWNTDRRRQDEGGLACFDLEGNELWRTGEDPYFERGNYLLAGETLLIQDGRNGVLSAVAASPEGFQLLGESDVFGEADNRRGQEMWAPMAYSDGHLVTRSKEKLVCLKL